MSKHQKDQSFENAFNELKEFENQKSNYLKKKTICALRKIIFDVDYCLRGQQYKEHKARFQNFRDHLRGKLIELQERQKGLNDKLKIISEAAQLRNKSFADKHPYITVLIKFVVALLGAFIASKMVLQF